MTSVVAGNGARLAIDLRQCRAGGEEATVLEAFEGLAAGESLVVVAAAAPGRLLGRLQTERKGLFEWSVLQGGPEAWRVEIARRDAQLGARREVNEALAWDHDRLEDLERRAFDLFAQGDAAGAQATWAEFATGLRRHIRFEEELLFPAFEAGLQLSPDAGPTAVMRAEHREIESLVEAIGRALRGEGAAEALRAELQHLLGGHNLKEEHVVYPGTDRVLDPAERDALVARIQAS